MPTEFFAPVNIREMHLDRRQIDGCQRVSHRDAGVGVGRGIDDDSLIPAACLLDPGHQFPFKIRLTNIEFHSKVLAELCEGCINGIQRGRPINGCFAVPQKIEVRAVEDQDAQHVGY